MGVVRWAWPRAMLVRVRAAWALSARQRAKRERMTVEPDADHQEARENPQPRVELLGKDVLGGGQRDEARARTRRPCGSRSPSARGSPRAVGVPRAPDQIAGDHRLAVAGRERVEGSPAEAAAEQEAGSAGRACCRRRERWRTRRGRDWWSPSPPERPCGRGHLAGARPSPAKLASRSSGGLDRRFCG